MGWSWFVWVCLVWFDLGCGLIWVWVDWVDLGMWVWVDWVDLGMWVWVDRVDGYGSGLIGLIWVCVEAWRCGGMETMAF